MLDKDHPPATQTIAMIVGEFWSNVPAVSHTADELSLLKAKPVMIVGAIPSHIPADIVSP